MENLFVTGDTHLPESIAHIDEFLTKSREDGIRYQMLHTGDMLANPPISEPNYARDAKVRARSSDNLDYIAAEEQLFDDPEVGSRVTQQWINIEEPSIRMINSLESIVKNGLVERGIITCLIGNDKDRIRRNESAKRRSGQQHSGHNLSDLMFGSPYFYFLHQMEFRVYGKALHILVPYIEDKEITDSVLEMYTNSAIEHFKMPEAKLRRIEQVIIFSHTNPDPRLRKEKNNSWYTKLYQIISDNVPHAISEKRAAHVFGHTHFTPQPYMWEGFKLYPIGWGDPYQKMDAKVAEVFKGEKQEHVHRFMTMEHSKLDSVRIKDVPLVPINSFEHA